MFDKRKEKELQDLSPEALEAERKQKSLNRIFWAVASVAALLFVMLIYEIILMIIR